MKPARGGSRPWPSLGHSLAHLDRLDEAEPCWSMRWRRPAAFWGRPMNCPDRRRVTWRTLRQHGSRQRCRGPLPAARGGFPPCPRAQTSGTLAALNNLGTVLQKEKKYEEAERLFRECLELSREVSGPQTSRHDRDPCTTSVTCSPNSVGSTRPKN